MRWTTIAAGIGLFFCFSACSLVSTDCEKSDAACNPLVLFLRPAPSIPSLLPPCAPLSLGTGNVIAVGSLLDTIAVDGVVTLREALTAANTDAASGDAAAGSGSDIIDLRSLSGVISLTSPLSVSSSLSLLGPCPLNLSMSGNSSVRVFDMTGAGTVFAGNLLVINGLVTGQQGGDGISDQSGGGGAAGMGGGVFLTAGTVTFDTVYFAGHEARGGRGGNGGAQGGGGSTAGANGGGPLFGTGGAGGAGGANGSAGGPGGYGSGGGAGGTASCCSGGSGGQGGTGGLYGGGGGGGGSRTGGNGLGAGAGGTFAGAGGNGCSSGMGGGGGGAGLGGVIFVRSGSLTLKNCVLTGNMSTGGALGTGTFGPGCGNGMAGQAKGGAVFLDGAFPFVNTGNVFTSNTAADAGSSTTDNADIYAP